jgi:two-component system NtrC family response regulator
MASICILDDHSLIRRLISETAGGLGHKVCGAATIAEGLALCRKQDFDVIFLDILLPDGNGLSVIPALRGLPSRPEIVIITSHGDPDGAELAIRHGAWDYLTKPLSVENLTLTLQRVVAFRQQQVPAAQFQLQPQGIIGESRALRACLESLSQASASNVSVLLLGETGTGKELFARAIHDNSPRAKHPFVALDCAALTESLLEARMFGHTRGSFTGADQSREGVFRLAHNGTLFLDEVGELPPSLQRSFLRVLETRRFRPIGAKEEVESDFRLIAATNRNLAEMADLGLFRQDLLYRLKGLTITLPPLRDRKEDIPLICRHFLERLCSQYGECAKSLSDDLLEALMLYHWPGNVRELAHALERAFAASAKEPVVFSWHLPMDIRMAVAKGRLQPPPAAPATAPITESAPSEDVFQSFREFREAAEQSYLKGLLSRAANMTEAARLSGLSRGHLYQLLKKHGLHTGLH